MITQGVIAGEKGGQLYIKIPCPPDYIMDKQLIKTAEVRLNDGRVWLH